MTTSTPSRLARMSGTFLVPGVSKNGRIYTHENIADAVKRMTDRIAANNHPTVAAAHDNRTDPLRVVGQVTKVEQLTNGAARFEADLYDSTAGRDIVAVTGPDKPVKAVSIWGSWVGQVTTDGEGNVTAPGMDLDGIDIVPNPGVVQALIDSMDIGESDRLRRGIRELAEAVIIEDLGPGPDYGDAAMIALYPSTDVAGSIALDGGLDPADLHVTLVFLGNVDDSDHSAVTTAVQTALAEHGPLAGVLSGIGRFSADDGDDPVYASLDVPGLTELRTAITGALDEAGVEYSSTHGFTPHMTLGYLPADDDLPAQRLDSTPVTFDRVAVVHGEARTDVHLTATPNDSTEESTVPDEQPTALTEAALTEQALPALASLGDALEEARAHICLGDGYTDISLDQWGVDASDLPEIIGRLAVAAQSALAAIDPNFTPSESAPAGNNPTKEPAVTEDTTKANPDAPAETEPAKTAVVEATPPGSDPKATLTETAPAAALSESDHTAIARSLAGLLQEKAPVSESVKTELAEQVKTAVTEAVKDAVKEATDAMRADVLKAYGTPPRKGLVEMAESDGPEKPMHEMSQEEFEDYATKAWNTALSK